MDELKAENTSLVGEVKRQKDFYWLEMERLQEVNSVISAPLVLISHHHVLDLNATMLQMCVATPAPHLLSSHHHKFDLDALTP